MTHHYILRNDDIKARLIGIIQGLSTSSPWEVELKPYKSRRSLAQNRILHMWMREVSQGYAEMHGDWKAPEVWKIYFKQLFLGQESAEVRGVTITYLRHSADLNTKEMMEFLDKIDAYCATELGLYLTHPAILYEEAMGK